MAHSSVVFGDGSLTMRESDVIVLSHITSDVSTRMSSDLHLTPNIRRLMRYWRTILTHYGVGTVDLDLDTYVRNGEDKLSLLGTLTFAAAFVRDNKSALDKDYLNGLIASPAILSFTEDCAPEPIQRAYDRLIELLENHDPVER